MKILTGRFKGRTLVFRPEPGLRPTSDKVRKAMVDALAGWIEGKRVLDLYSGTGALGLELLSAGAALAVFVEQDAVRARRLRAWIEKAGAASETRVHSGDVRAALARMQASGERFDLAVLDPPYADAAASRVLSRLAPLLEPESFVVYECRASQDAPDAAELEIARDRIYGDTRLVMYRKKKA